MFGTKMPEKDVKRLRFAGLLEPTSEVRLLAAKTVIKVRRFEKEDSSTVFFLVQTPPHGLRRNTLDVEKSEQSGC
jgi:hypothetical protein